MDSSETVSHFFYAADTFPSRVFYVLDLLGTMSFAFSGAIRAMDRKPDIIGMLILAAVTALGGAIFRDGILNRNVIVLVDPMYTVMIVLAVLITFFYPSKLFRSHKMFQYFDAVGLAVFAAVTASVAWQTFHLHPISVTLIACFGGCAGGVVRDLVIQKPTVVLSNEIVVMPVIVGAICLMTVESLGFGELAGFIAAVFVGTVLRIIAIIGDLRFPRIMYVEKPPKEKKPKNKRR
ncbi:MAG: TRIC cation channel family protein [Planctomycetaceae bacterium]|nr:TRIC cation channel family protein [Planctomycetaceae bacterium]